MIVHSANDFTTKILDHPHDIRLAQQLLFHTYIQDQNWLISENNPSGIKIETDIDGKQILIDELDPFSTWVGTFHNNNLVACGRIVGRDNNGLLEIERYVISDKLKAKICVSSMPNLVELNRSAIHPKYRNTIIWPCLLYFAFKFCNTRHLSAISTTGYNKVIQFHHAIGYKAIRGEQFKYHPTDKNPVEVYLADISKGDIAAICKNLEEIINKKTTSCEYWQIHGSPLNKQQAVLLGSNVRIP